MGNWNLVLNVNAVFPGRVFSHRTDIHLIPAPEPVYSDAEPWGSTAIRLDKEISPFVTLRSSNSGGGGGGCSSSGSSSSSSSSLQL
jgi:hypothetical protein